MAPGSRRSDGRTVATAAVVALSVLAAGTAPAYGQGSSSDQAAIPYVPVFADAQGKISSVALLQSNGSLSQQPVPDPYGTGLQPVAFPTPSGFAVLVQSGDETGGIESFRLAPNGGYSGGGTLGGGSLAVTPVATRAPNGDLIATDFSGVFAGERDNELAVFFNSANGNLVVRSSYTTNENTFVPLALVPRADSSVWLIAAEGSTVTVRRVTRQGTPLGRRVIRRSSFSRFFLSTADDGRGGLFVLLTEAGRGRTPPTGMRAIHVSGTGAVDTRRVARVSGRRGSILGGNIVLAGERARIVYYVGGRVSRRVRGVFTRRFNTAGALSGKRRLARSGTVEDVATPPQGGSIFVLRRSAGLRIHRVGRGRFGGGRLVTRSRSASSGSFGLDGSGRAYVVWAQRSTFSGCGQASQNPRDAFARVVGSGPLSPVRVVSRCVGQFLQPVVR